MIGLITWLLADSGMAVVGSHVVVVVVVVVAVAGVVHAVTVMSLDHPVPPVGRHRRAARVVVRKRDGHSGVERPDRAAPRHLVGGAGRVRQVQQGVVDGGLPEYHLAATAPAVVIAAVAAVPARQDGRGAVRRRPARRCRRRARRRLDDRRTVRG